MKLINQHTKKIMEGCKERAKDVGLQFDNESLEYVVTNSDMLELSPKVMIPTMYDYWVNDIEVFKSKEEYKLYPHNPFETVINSRPAISFYNDNNPDWLNVMIFYHVLAHIDFFQNNQLFAHTWNDDFVGRALADKRQIAALRGKYGRWVDYTIEFARCIDNLVAYFPTLNKDKKPNVGNDMLSFYFNIFLQRELKYSEHQIFKEIERYNDAIESNSNVGEVVFLNEIIQKHPEFETRFKEHQNREVQEPSDLMEFIRDQSPFLNRSENKWMKIVLDIIRNTSLYFSPQIRTKIINEGWASYWHDKLFMMDDRIKGNEVAYAKINASVTSIRRIGLNPYAIGLRLVQEVEDLANKGKLSYEFQKLQGIDARDSFNNDTNKGQEAIFTLRKHFSDFTLINAFTSQEFVDKHDLMVIGKRFNQERNTQEYYVKSKKAGEYKNMLVDSLYHPPHITVNTEKTDDDNLHLVHTFENKQLYQPYIQNTMMSIGKLWGGNIHLETSDIRRVNHDHGSELQEIRVLITWDGSKLDKKTL